MSGSPMINGLAVFFTITTVAVFLYPIIKLTPSWLERRVNRQIGFHRGAIAALGSAMAGTDNDHAHRARLAAQHDYHRAALMALAPDDAIAATTWQDIDAAA